MQKQKSTTHFTACSMAFLDKYQWWFCSLWWNFHGIYASFSQAYDVSFLSQKAPAMFCLLYIARCQPFLSFPWSSILSLLEALSSRGGGILSTRVVESYTLCRCVIIPYGLHQRFPWWTPCTVVYKNVYCRVLPWMRLTECRVCWLSSCVFK